MAEPLLTFPHPKITKDAFVAELHAHRAADRIIAGTYGGGANKFLKGCAVGADLTMVWPRFALWLLSEEVPKHTKRAKSLAALSDVAALYREWCEGTKPTNDRWLKARSAAYADAYARVKCYERQADKLIELIQACAP